MVNSDGEEWVSLREFARRREVALSAVQKAIESGRVTAVRRDSNGRLKKIEINRATREWDSKTDPVQAARSGQFLQAPEGPLNPELPLASAGEEKEPAGASAADPQGGQHDSYYAARAKREQYAAKEAELKYLQTIGSLVSAEEVRTIAARRYRAVRDAILAIADQEAPILAAERDPIQIRERLTRAFKKVLHELSDSARAEAAGGDPERLAA